MIIAPSPPHVCQLMEEAEHFVKNTLVMCPNCHRWYKVVWEWDESGKYATYDRVKWYHLMSNLRIIRGYW
jgi:hypothetical protein